MSEISSLGSEVDQLQKLLNINETHAREIIELIDALRKGEFIQYGVVELTNFPGGIRPRVSFHEYPELEIVVTSGEADYSSEEAKPLHDIAEAISTTTGFKAVVNSRERVESPSGSSRLGIPIARIRKIIARMFHK